MSYSTEWDPLQGVGSSVYDELAYLQQENTLKPTLDDFALAPGQLDALVGASPAAESDHTVHLSPHQLYGDVSYSSPSYSVSPMDGSVSFSAPAGRSLSFEGGAPSPIPALSPPRSGTAFSSPSSSASSYGGVVSPRQLPLQGQPGLLPPVEVYSLAPSGLAAPPQRPGFARRGSSTGDGPSWFADAQEQYLTQQYQKQQQQHDYQPYPQQPMYAPPPQPDFAQHRSPHRGSFSTPGQPHMSPYSRLAGQAALDRRGSTGNLRYDAMVRSGAVGRDPRASPVRRASLVAMGDATPPRPHAVKRRGSRLSIAVPPLPSGDVPQASPLEQSQSSEEIDQILQMVDMMGSFDHAPQGQAMQLQASTSSQGHARYQQQRPPPLQLNTSQLPMPAPFTGTIEVSGVALDPEDLEMLVSPDPNQYQDGVFGSRAYPASAPAWQTTFNQGPPPPMPQYSQASYGHYPTSSAYPPAQYAPYPAPPYSAGLAPPASFAPSRPHSAPGVTDPAPGLVPPPLLRRGSSLRDSTTAEKAAPAPAPASAVLAAPPKPPAKTPKKGVGKKAKKDAGGIGGMFVNYGASDAKKLLSGVAPSGSSKRKREEEEAARLAALAAKEGGQEGEVAA